MVGKGFGPMDIIHGGRGLGHLGCKIMDMCHSMIGLKGM